jgi:ketosteroid isomerase-like protein
VQRHVVHGTAKGETIAADVCIVFHVADDKITKIYEYLDQAAVAVVFGLPTPSA